MSSTVHPLRRALTTSSTSGSFGSGQIPTVTEPTGEGKFDLLSAKMGVGTDPNLPRFIQIIPWGTDANNETHNLRLWGWSKVNPPGTAAASVLYIPQLLLEIAYTLGNISGTAIEPGAFLADTITITYGDTDAPEISTAADLPGSILCHLRGCQYIEFDFKIGTGAAANCYWRAMNQGH